MKQFIIIFSFLFSSILLSQELTLTGTISATKTKEILPLSAVTIFDAVTNKLITYAYSDDNGKYTVTFTNKSFYIKVETLGYITFKSETMLVSGTEKVFNISLQVDVSELDTVTI